MDIPIIKRREAKALGLNRYYTGKPCRRAGHLSERHTKSAKCIACRKELSALRNRDTAYNRIRMRLWRDKHREHYRKYQREYQREYQRRKRLEEKGWT